MFNPVVPVKVSSSLKAGQTYLNGGELHSGRAEESINQRRDSEACENYRNRDNLVAGDGEQ